MAIHERSASTLSLCAVRMEGSAMTGFGPRLPTWALQQVGSYLGYTGHQINVVVTAARDPKRPLGPVPGSYRATPFAAEMLGASTPLVPGDAIVSASQSASGQQ
jgi:hypothetical protein